MFVYTSGRRMGKTSAVIRWFLEDPEHSVIVVFDERRKLHIWQEILHHLSTPPQHWKENIVVGLFGGYYARGKDWRRVAIDDLDSFLESFVHIKPELVTVTGTAIGPTLEVVEKPPWATEKVGLHPMVRSGDETQEITREAAEKFGIKNVEAPGNTSS